MPKETYKVLDLEQPIDERPFHDFAKDLDVSSGFVGKYNLSNEAFRSFASVIFTYGLHHYEIRETQRERFLQGLIKREMNLYKISEDFAKHLLNNLSVEGKSEFDRLMKSNLDVSNPLSNMELVDFVEMELLDPVTSYRKWEYGQFVLKWFSSRIFQGLQESQSLSVNPLFGPEMDTVLKKFMENIESEESDLESYEKILLQLIFKQKLKPQSSNIAEGLLTASIVQERMLQIVNRFKLLYSVLSKAYTKKPDRGKRRGRGPKL